MKLVENNNVELKRTLNDKFEREVIAFLNTKNGGNIYIGVDDAGKVFGVENVDSL